MVISQFGVSPLVEFSTNNWARQQEDWGPMELEELDDL
jgi:hypothetical protein